MSLISNSWILVLLWMIVYSDPAFSCGGLVTGRKGEITTPNFPSSYGNNLDCTWTIQVDDNETITILFLTFNVEKSRILGVACADTFSVYDGPDKASTQLITPCGYGIPGPLHSSGNALTLTFDSDWSYGYSGVHLKWKVSDKFTLHTEAKTWEEANAVCVKDGGHLAVMTDLNKQLILNVLSDLWIGEYYTPRIWLKDGVSTPSACKTIEKTYDGLITSFQPNCQLSLAFICQKDAVLCGGKFYNNSGTISSPGYPGEYENNDYCEWEIYVSEERVIEIVFHDVDIEQTGSKTCPFDYIEVLENHIKPPKSIRKICGESSNVSIISASNQVLITFKTDKAVSKRGFYLEWMSDLIPTTTSTTDTTTTSTIDAHKAGLGGATLAGIVIGAVLAILVVMVIVLVVLVLKRKKEHKAGAQTILELKALENTETAKTPSNSETPQQTGDSGNPYERLHTPDLYVHTYDSMVHETGDMHDHFDSDKTDSLDKDVKETDAYANETLQKMQKPNVYDFTTAAEGQNHQETFNVIKADKTDSLHNKDEDSIKTEYMNSGSNEIVTKGFHDRENYLMPIGENLNNTMGHTNTAGIQTKNTSKNDDYYNKEVDIEDDTQQNVSDDKTNEQTADSEQHLYTEIENSEQDYENP